MLNLPVVFNPILFKSVSITAVISFKLIICMMSEHFIQMNFNGKKTPLQQVS